MGFAAMSTDHLGWKVVSALSWSAEENFAAWQATAELGWVGSQVCEFLCHVMVGCGTFHPSLSFSVPDPGLSLNVCQPHRPNLLPLPLVFVLWGLCPDPLLLSHVLGPWRSPDCTCGFCLCPCPPILSPLFALRSPPSDVSMRHIWDIFVHWEGNTFLNFGCPPCC